MRIFSTALATAICVTAASTAAYAAEDGASVANERVGVSATANDNINGNPDTAADSVAEEVANSRVDTGMNFSSLETTINTYGTTGFDGSLLDTVEGGDMDVSVIPVTEIDGMNAQNEARLDQIITEQKQHINQIADDLKTRGEIQSELSDAGYTADDVIAVQTGVNGQVSLVVNDLS